MQHISEGYFEVVVGSLYPIMVASSFVPNKYMLQLSHA